MMPSAQLTWNAACTSGCSSHIDAAWNYRDLLITFATMNASMARVAMVNGMACLNVCISANMSMHQADTVQPSLPSNASKRRFALPLWGGMSPSFTSYATSVAMHSRSCEASPASPVQWTQDVRKIPKYDHMLLPCQGAGLPILCQVVRGGIW